MEEQPPRSTERRSSSHRGERRTLFSREQNSDKRPLLESPIASQSKETTGGNDGRAAADRTAPSPQAPQLRTGRKTAAPDHRDPGRRPRLWVVLRGFLAPCHGELPPGVPPGRRGRCDQAPWAGSAEGAARFPSPYTKKMRQGAASDDAAPCRTRPWPASGTASPVWPRREWRQVLPCSRGALRCSLRCSERRWMPRRRADSEMFPPQSDRTRWMCSHSMRASDGAR